MKKIQVSINSDCGCMGFDYGTSDGDTFEVDEPLFEALHQLQSAGLLSQDRPLDNLKKRAKATGIVIKPAMLNKIAELKDKIFQLARESDAYYWITASCDHDACRVNIVESLEIDIANGKFIPLETQEEFLDSCEEEYDDEVDARDAYLNSMVEIYVEWLLDTHTLQEAADITGTDLDAFEPDEISYTIWLPEEEG